MIATATLFSVSWTYKYFYQCFVFHTTARTGSVRNLSRPVDQGRQIYGQENLSPLGLAVQHRATYLLVAIHQSMTFSVYLCLKSFYTHIAWSNYGLDVLNIAQTYLFVTCDSLDEILSATMGSYKSKILNQF